VGFFADGKLKRIDIAGGTPQILADASIGRGGTWGPDGTILFAPLGTSALFRIAASGGESIAVTKLDKQTGHRFPQFLPDGRQFLFYAQGTPETAGIYLGSLDSSETKRLLASDVAGRYLSAQAGSATHTSSPNGWLLFIRGTTLFAQRMDLGRQTLMGDPVKVADPVASNAGTFVGGYSVSASGLVAYRSGGAGKRQLTWYDRSGKVLGTLGAPDETLVSPRLSPDGQRVAVSRTVQGNADIWLIDEARTTRFTIDAGFDRFPVWSPDGSRLVFDSNRKDQRRNLYVKAANGAGSEELLLDSEQAKVAADWSRDGRFIGYLSLDPQTSYDLWVLPMEGERKPFVFLKTNFAEGLPQFSPDGRWLAYESNESGKYEIYVRPFTGRPPGASSGGQWQVSTAGGDNLRWRSDGKELYYITPDGKLMAAPITTSGATFVPGTPVVLFQTRVYGASDPLQGPQYDVSPDGRFLINTALEEADSPITLLQNWNPETKK
jgi:Tol biopolymer transport system component